ncbi:hypothetical protein DRN44_03770 [Thermococci archaeon]|nr:MAG: hypothetical protein DRN44_03770 [Thermococci archaeon]
MKEENKEVINITERTDVSEQGAESNVSTGKKRTCPYCDAEFTQSIDLTRHVKYKHPKHASKKAKDTHKAQTKTQAISKNTQANTQPTSIRGVGGTPPLSTFGMILALSFVRMLQSYAPSIVNKLIKLSTTIRAYIYIFSAIGFLCPIAQ